MTLGVGRAARAEQYWKMGLGAYSSHWYTTDFPVRKGRQRWSSCRIASCGRMAHETRYCRL